MMQSGDSFTMTIDGRAVAASSTLRVINPATEDIVALAPRATRQDLNAAIASARRGLPKWSGLAIAERRTALCAVAECLKVNAEKLKAVLTAEQGKPYADAMMEIMASAFWLESFAQHDLPVEVVEDGPTHRIEIRRVPVGVVGAIVPWNFPIMLAFGKIGAALLAGNTVVLKPSPYTPLTTLKIGELLKNVLPAGVLNVISGDDELGPWMTGHRDIDKIAFTGSTATGRNVMQSAASSLKRLTLELGGNDPAIVMPDVDIDTTAQRLFWTAFMNNGQVCINAKRMYVHESIYDRFAMALVKYAGQIKVGDGAKEGTQIGPIQNGAQYHRVCELIADARRDGFKFLCGGEVPEGKGYFVPLTIVDNPPDDSRVVVEEAFGPVLPLLKFSDVDEVIARANNSEFGLGASVWSADLDQAYAIAARLQAGTIWVNTSHYGTPSTPLGGHKQSGLGVENGRDGLLAYTNPKVIIVQKSTASA